MLVLGEAQKLRQALINVMKNGIEATNAGGKLSILLEEKDGRIIRRRKREPVSARWSPSAS